MIAGPGILIRQYEVSILLASYAGFELHYSHLVSLILYA